METSDWLRLGLLIFVLPLVGVFVALARMRFRVSTRRRLPDDAAPEWMTSTVASAGRELEALGFELISPIELIDAEVTDQDTRIAFQLYQPQKRIWAYLSVHGAMREEPFHLRLESFVRGPEGKTMLVLSEPAWHAPELAASSRLRVGSAPLHEDVRAMVSLHAAAAPDALELEPDEALALACECHAAWLEEAEQAGRMVREQDVHFRFGLLGTLRAVKWWRFDSGVTRANAENIKLSAGEAAASSAIEATRYVQLESVLARSLPRTHALLLFITGALLFLAWFGASDPVIALALFLAVLIHEAGHALAMKAMGYRDARIYFVPGLGGAAVGEKRDASIHQEGIVLLAGPVPGIAIGFGLVLVLRLVPEGHAVHVPLFTLAGVFLAINALNLLPTLPLDGGRLVHRILASLHPALDMAFRVLSIVGLAALAILFGDFLLGFLSLSIALQTPSAYLAATIEHALRARGASSWDEAQRLEETFKAIKLRGWTRRYATAKQVMLRLAAPEASAFERALWSLLYVGVVLAIVVAGVLLATAFALAG